MTYGTHNGLHFLLVLLTISMIAIHAQIAPPHMSKPNGRIGAAIPLCKLNQLTLSTDGEDGNFNGMQHGGTLLVLRNISETACQVDAIPKITFSNAKHALNPKAEMEDTAPMRPSSHPGLHPGPMVPPVTVPGGAEVTSTLGWTSGPAFVHNVCIDPKTIAVEVGGETTTQAFDAHMCGEAGKGVIYHMTRFKTDPTLPAR